jgi:hypothetical protein
MKMSVEAELSELIKGLKCTNVTRFGDLSWRFEFEDFVTLDARCAGRIISNGRMASGNEDHGQWYGLPAPVDGVTAATQLLSSNSAERITIQKESGDIHLEFDSGTRLEVANYSSGYEGWECFTKSGLDVIGVGGGEIATYSAGPGIKYPEFETNPEARLPLSPTGPD